MPREALGGQATSQIAARRTPSGPRDREIGILDYAARYETSTSKRALVQAGQECWKLVEEAGLKPQWFDVDLLLPAGRAERNRFRRIFLPASVAWLSQPMLEGLADYVESGGLLVTNASLILLDANANYKADPGEGTTRFASDGFLGVLGHAGCTMDRIKVVRPCPLTAGLADGWDAALAPGRGPAHCDPFGGDLDRGRRQCQGETDRPATVPHVQALGPGSRDLPGGPGRREVGPATQADPGQRALRRNAAVVVLPGGEIGRRVTWQRPSLRPGGGPCWPNSAAG